MTIPAKWKDHEGLADSFDPASPSPLVLEMRRRQAAVKVASAHQELESAFEIAEANAVVLTFCAHCNEPMTGEKCLHCEGRFEK